MSPFTPLSTAPVVIQASHFSQCWSYFGEGTRLPDGFFGSQTSIATPLHGLNPVMMISESCIHDLCLDIISVLPNAVV